MADYLTQPSSTESAVSKVRKIRSELQKQKEKVSKKREKFAKRTLGLEVGMAIGNAALKGALNRYQLRNQPELNLLKAQKQQALDFILQNNEAMKTHGSVDNYVFHNLKDRYQNEVTLKSGEDYVYSSDHWSDELKADVAEKTKAYKDYLAASRNISEGNIDQAFAGLKEQALPSNMWDWFTRGSKKVVRGHDATTIKLKADGSFDKLINNPIFAAHKDFQIQAKLYNSYFPGALQGVLADIDKEAKAGTLQDRVAQTQFVSKVVPRVEHKIVDGEKVVETTQRLVVEAIQTTPTGKLIIPEEPIIDRAFEGGQVPEAIIAHEQLKVYNSVLLGRGQTRLAQLLNENEEYMLDPSKAYIALRLEGDNIGIKNKTNVNPYIKPDIDQAELLQSYYLEAGKAAQAYFAEVSKENYMVDGKLDLEAYNKQIEIRDELVKNYFTRVGKVGLGLIKGVTTPNVALPPKP